MPPSIPVYLKIIPVKPLNINAFANSFSTLSRLPLNKFCQYLITFRQSPRPCKHGLDLYALLKSNNIVNWISSYDNFIL